MSGVARLAVVRDVVILFSLSVISGLFTSIAMPGKLGTVEHAQVNRLLTLVLVTVGFTIVGTLSSTNRWRQLLIVGAILWLIGGFINITFYDLSVQNWLQNLVHLVLTLLIGGALSYIFRSSQSAGN